MDNLLSTAKANEEEVVFLPREKELEQLPMSNTSPSMEDDQSKVYRTSLKGVQIPKKRTTSQRKRRMT